MKKLFLLSFAILNSYWSLGQVCGTSAPTQVTIYPEEPSNARGASSLLCIDVFFHIVRNTNGTDAFTPPNLNDVVSNLNEFYSPHNIVINNSGFEFINNTNFTNIDNDVEAANLGQTNNRSDAINYYIVETLWNVGDDFVTGTANNIPSNNLVIRNDRVLTSTSPHELGHCLNLLHTHETSEGTEAINGSNCQTAGDLICDTPADEGQGIMNGYNPDLTNIMSYYRPRDHFTTGQGGRMRNAISQESALQGVTGNTCVRISEVNNVCPSETITITLTNLGGATTVWTKSNNVQIVSSNNFEAVLRAANGYTNRDGWVTATLNNGIILTEQFKVGPVNLDPFYIALEGYMIDPSLNNAVWNYVNVWSDTHLGETSSHQWNITATGSAIRHNEGQPIAMIRPNQNWGTIQIGIQVENSCTTEFKWRTFNVNGASGRGRPGQIHPE